jgi:phosphoribosylamine--glycine ligase
VGVEISVARYFNGLDWVGPIEISFEHTKLFPGELGPTTDEMGTLAWYTKTEKLFDETLGLLKNFLQKANFKGDIAINCIVNKKGTFPLEVTPRIGTPIIHIQEELHESPWGEFLYAIASGKDYDLKWKDEYGIAVLMATPPFPYGSKSKYNTLFNTNIYFDKNLSSRDFDSIHFEEIGKRKNSEQFYLSDSRGYTSYITGHGKTVEEARYKTYSLIDKIHIPKLFYRNDIGISFILKEKRILNKLGYLKNSTNDVISKVNSFNIFWHRYDKNKKVKKVYN